ncbi:hypothetical protein M2407_005108 [Serratia sp. BIGb0234]|nr:hypothetical protein [Serratia sp. BIGb0234]
MSVPVIGFCVFCVGMLVIYIDWHKLGGAISIMGLAISLYSQFR